MAIHLPDGTVLTHERRPYDPVKAHEYYLRTRKLKGREKRVAEAGARAVAGLKAPTGNRNKQKRAAAQQVEGIKRKLSLLNAELKKRMAESAVDTVANKKPTAADKAEKARDAEKYRDKHKQEIKTKARQASAKKSDGPAKKGDGKQSVAELKQTIGDLRKKLAAAVARQRALG